ncbi:hypothetical protein ABW99_11345 [Pandoraea thiooxydans]|uniref:TMEM205-like domain-containing protein n=1 Tax=Pandoraea thiooxydans TaxID=445709 RepID=A0A0G3ENZ9_9BURK|nr:DUF4149 domain-containing protein [Pandoraea thiooxydans]AKJ68720.1 hypothetical protein ABW99_11345 [Pandoraea thiooxydans]
MSATSESSNAVAGPVPVKVYRLLATIWCGSQWTIGYLVAPTLFALLENRRTAGSLAASLFRSEAILGIVCGVLLLLLGNALSRAPGGAAVYRPLRWIVAGMMVCVLFGYFALAPWMDQLRTSAAVAGVDIEHSAYAARFGLLHGVSTGFYVLQSLLGLALIWRLPAAGATRRIDGA